MADTQSTADAGFGPRPEIRVDPISGDRVIIAAERSERPGGELRSTKPEPIDPAADPFLDGGEDRTPPELFALRPSGGPADSPGWSVRVVPNRYPALVDDASGPPATPPASGPVSESELFTSLPANGAHEVIVNGPQQVLSLADLSAEQVAAAAEVWRERILTHSTSAACVQLIVNERPEAGASLPHTHAQLYALPFVPAEIARERERFRAHSERTMGQNLMGDLVQEEVRLGERVIAIDKEAVLLAPYASKLPFQMMLAPRTPAPRFESPGPTGARLLHEGLSRLARHLGASPPLNLWVRTAPLGTEEFCWRIDVMPRLTHIAGLELSTGLALNILAPERAAEILREA